MSTSQKRPSEVVTVKVNPVKFRIIVMFPIFPALRWNFSVFLLKYHFKCNYIMLNNTSYSANNVCNVWTNELPHHMQQGGLVHFLSFSNFLGKVNFRKLVLRALIAILI